MTDDPIRQQRSGPGPAAGDAGSEPATERPGSADGSRRTSWTFPPQLARPVAISGLIGILLYVGWTRRARLDMLVPAMLIASVIGLIGVGVYWLVLCFRRRRMSELEVFFTSAFTIAAAVVAAVLYREGGLRFVQGLNALIAGFSIASLFVLAGIAIRGLPPDAYDDAESAE